MERWQGSHWELQPARCREAEMSSSQSGHKNDICDTAGTWAEVMWGHAEFPILFICFFESFLSPCPVSSIILYHSHYHSLISHAWVLASWKQFWFCSPSAKLPGSLKFKECMPNYAKQKAEFVEFRRLGFNGFQCLITLPGIHSAPFLNFL